MSRELVVLSLRRGRACQVWHYLAERAESLPLEQPDAAAEFARLIDAYPDAYIAWFDERLEPHLADISTWPGLVRHPLEVLHLSCFQRCDLMVESLGLVDFESPYLLAGPTDRRFGTWLVSPTGGIGLAALFRAVGFDSSLSFPLALFDFGHRGAQWGVCPSSDPGLLKAAIPPQVVAEIGQPLAPQELAILIRRLYGRKWVLFWLLGCLLFLRSFPLIGALSGWLSPPGRPGGDPKRLRSLQPPQSAADSRHSAVDVVIPTLDRPQHVANVLQDLAAQTLPPERVVLVEQNPSHSRKSPLADMVGSRRWPFEIRHHFVNWIGACRARNLAFRECRGEWVLLLDDDVRLRPNLVAYLVQVARTYQVEAVNAAVYLPHQEPDEVSVSSLPRLWPHFASGASLVSRKIIDEAEAFDQRLEGGFGEDYEFGVRLRLHGASVLYAPGEPILHLKAPSGGFRYVFPHPWMRDKTLPRPSPTVLYSRQKHLPALMQKGYLLFYWTKRLAATPPYRWPIEARTTLRQWRSSAKWSKWLSCQNPGAP